MNYRIITKYIGYIMICEGIFMIPALLISAYCRENAAVKAFAVTIIFTVAVGFLLSRMQSLESIEMSEGFVICALGWIVMSLCGAVPFHISGCIPNFMDCWFETVSGFTTTGSSIIAKSPQLPNAVESLPYGLLYWRSFTHWLGGMGVLVFLLAVVPLSRGNGQPFNLMRAESPGPDVGKMTPKISATGRALYGIYAGMTLVMIVMLIAEGMPVFDSVVNTFATAGTGGFAIKNASIGYEGYTVLQQQTIGVWMALFGVNFSVYYLLVTRQFRAAFTNEEFRGYWGILLGTSLLIALNIFFSVQDYAGNFVKAWQDSFFSCSSIMTTTGFATANFDKWPEFSRYLIMVLMIIGASAGSTGGGIKVSRLLLLFKYLKREMGSIIRPRRIGVIRMDQRRVSDSVMRGTIAFMVAYCAIVIVSMALVSLDNESQVTTISAVLSCMNNIGPGLDKVGPVGNFSEFSNFSKFVLSMDMLLGRLEIFPILFLLSPAVWKRKGESYRQIADSIV